jgi:hypothetical protein
MLAKKKVYREFVLVLVCLFVAGSLAPGTLLCFGADGHISVEFASADCCGEYSDASSQISRDLHLDTDPSIAAADSCGDCVDIPFWSYYFAQRPNSKPKVTLVLTILPKVIISASDCIHSMGTNEGFITERRNAVNHTLASIRTTVLII